MLVAVCLAGCLLNEGARHSSERQAIRRLPGMRRGRMLPQCRNRGEGIPSHKVEHLFSEDSLFLCRRFVFQKPPDSVGTLANLLIFRKKNECWKTIASPYVKLNALLYGASAKTTKPKPTSAETFRYRHDNLMG